MAKQSIFSLIFSVILGVDMQAQVNSRSELFIELRKQDSIFFERGFNQCDLVYLKGHITDDLKFYHDQSGFQNRTVFLENIQEYICAAADSKPIRQLEASSLEVFPLYKDGVLYGAIQKGIHHFYLREQGEEDKWTSTARFTHVWLQQDDVWKISEVLSYDHHDPEVASPPGDIEKLLIENDVPALGLGIIKNGELTKIEVYGTLDQQRVAPHNTIFKMASLTKPIVAIVTLKLIDKGLLDLNEPLYKYWIDLDVKDDNRHRKLTPKLVLTHQTGFPNWRYLNEDNKLTFQFEPGTQYQYSGEGFEYLRKAIENKFGKSIEELAEEYLFTPLGMSDTHFWWNSEMDESRYAQNFDANGEKIETARYYEASAACNLLTTVEDYSRFLEYLISGAGLSEGLYDEMLKPQVQIKDDEYFGLGWQILTDFSNTEYAMLHTGNDPGVSTLAIWFPKSKNGYLIFMNGDNKLRIYEELLTKRLYLGNDLWDKR